MLLSPARILELNVAANNDDRMREERQAEVQRVIEASPAKGRLLNASLKLSQKAPKLAESLLDILSRGHGYQFLGNGAEYSAYRDTKTGDVVKVHRRSIELSPAERLELAAHRDKQYEDAKQNLLFLLPQSIEIGEHVLGGGYDAVKLHQPYVEFGQNDAPFMHNQPDGVDLAHLEDLQRRFPGIDEALKDLIASSYKHHEQTGYLPDVNGKNNVVAQPGGDVRLLDSGMIGPEQPVHQAIMLGHLRTLGRGLLEVS